MSQLRLSGFDDKGNSYIWCSVDPSNDTQTMTSNPSVVLHILHQFEAECSVGQGCTEQINLYGSYSTARCADHEVSVNVIEAQDCTATVTPAEETSNSDSPTPTMALQTTAQQTTALPATGQLTLALPAMAQQTTALPAMAQQTLALHTTAPQTTSQHATTITVTSAAPSLPLGMETVIGISMGGVILILCFIIGLLATCMMNFKMKLKNQTREHRIGSQLDEYVVMCSSERKLEKDKVDDTDRVSKMLCESNASYECPHTAISQPTENIYEYIH